MKIARNLSMGSPFFAVFQKGVRPEISASAFPCDETLAMPDKALARPSSVLFSNGNADPRYGKS